jgi:hypothetical protein
MKQAEMTRAVKEELWRQFDAKRTFTTFTFEGRIVAAEAVEKQRQLWAAFRKRNPK